MKVIDYAQARNEISDGDIVFVMNGESIWSKLTQTVTQSDVFHCGIAFWVRDPRYPSRLFILEAHQGGRRIVSLSAYQKHSLAVIESPVDWTSLSDAMLENTGSVPYSYMEYIWIGLLELFGMKRPDDDAGEVCSKMVALYCKLGGVDLETDISPGKLKTTLLDIGMNLKCLVSNKLITPQMKGLPNESSIPT